METGPEPPSQAPKRKSPATRKRDAQRASRHQKKAVAVKTTDTQTSAVNHQNRVTQTQKTITASQAICTSPVKTIDTSSACPSFDQGKPLTPTKYRIDDIEYTSRKPYVSCSTIRSPYNPMKACHRTTFEDGDVHFSEGFDIDNCEYDPGESAPPTAVGPRPLTPFTSPPVRQKKKQKKRQRQLHM